MRTRSPAAVAGPSLRLSAEGRILGADAGARRLLTGDAEGDGLVGSELAALVAEPQRDAVVQLIASAPAAPLRAEIEISHAGSHPRPVELLLAPAWPDGDGARLTASLRDISDRRLAERLRTADAAMLDAFAAGESPARAARRLLATLAEALPSGHGSWFTRGPDGSLELAARWPAEPFTPSAAGPPGENPADHPPGGPDDDPAAVAARAVAPRELAARALAAEAIVEQAHPGAIAIPLGDDAEPRSVVVLSTDGAHPGAVARQALADVGARAGQLLAILEDRHSRIDALARLALTDELTGLPNRRSWEEMLARELAGAARDERPVCVAVLDLDHFKLFNDAHGHQAGDRLLREAAHAWQRQLRLSDLLARYGGEEFAAIIPAWPLPIATAVIERLRRATPGGLTASAGITIWDGAESGAELFGRADAALYAAKQAGRDRTVAVSGDDDGGAGPRVSETGRAPEPLPRAS